MRNASLRSWIILAAVLASAPCAQAQMMPGGPVFANDPQDPALPEFCPPQLPAITRTPFDSGEPPPNAFVEAGKEEGGSPCVYYFGMGTLGLSRSSLNRNVIAVYDPGVNIPGVPFNVDTGNLPPAGAPVAARLSSVPADYHWGTQATLGFQKGEHAFEFSGFWIAQRTSGRTINTPGQLDLLFGNVAPPLGFEGDNTLWLQADRLTVELQSRLGSAELNYRNIFGPEFELLLGVRYVDLQEIFRIITDDDVLVAPPSDPFRRANYEVESNSHLVGGQFGFEASHFLIPGRFALGMSNKNMIGVDFFDVENRLIRGDGFERTAGSRNGTQLSGLVELDAFMTICFGSQVRLKAGYQALWLFNVPEAASQINFDPNVIQGSVQDHGHIFYHGPRIELQFAF